VVFACAVRGSDPKNVVADERRFENDGRGGVRLQAALCALELLMPIEPESEAPESP
jgi:nicotinamide-nucleotide amidase